MNDPEAEADRARRIQYMCTMVEQLGKDNGSGEQYLVALTICAGRYLRGIEDEVKKAQTLRMFLQAVRQFAGSKHDAN